jgi:hypothetical protein
MLNAVPSIKEQENKGNLTGSVSFRHCLSEGFVVCRSILGGWHVDESPDSATNRDSHARGAYRADQPGQV